MEKEPINRPFTDLPAFVNAHKIHLKEFTETAIRTNIKDDACLLTEAMQNVRAIDENKKRIMKKDQTLRCKLRYFLQIEAPHQ